MRIVSSIHVHAHLNRAFNLAAEVDRWPDLLPHYRSARIIANERETRVVEMTARRGWIPLKWALVQRPARADRRIYCKHVDGLTRGMWTEWSFIPLDAGVQITIVQDFNLQLPIVGSRLGRWAVARFLAKPIADQTLRCLKALAEESPA
jgi:ribosome-associated toxin RatA of RatAB toxin-antitoxin module